MKNVKKVKDAIGSEVESLLEEIRRDFSCATTLTDLVQVRQRCSKAASLISGAIEEQFGQQMALYAFEYKTPSGRVVEGELAAIDDDHAIEMLEVIAEADNSGKPVGVEFIRELDAMGYRGER